MPLAFSKIHALLRAPMEFALLPMGAKHAVMRDLSGLKDDEGAEATVRASLRWLLRAQAFSTSNDGGVARHFSLIDGWGDSYPETTGYIVSTMLESAERFHSTEFIEAARRMTDWLVTLQFPDGGFPGGTVNQQPVMPVTFNTGQILLGLVSATEKLGNRYEEPMRRAAEWLVATQDADGAWRSQPTPFAHPGDKSYETHVAWALLEAARLTGDDAWTAAAIRNVDWALGRQLPNGWFDDCCLQYPARPLTHTIGYALRGIVEAHRHTGERRFLEGAVRTADALASCLRSDGHLAGRWNAQWRPAVSWVCLTGTAQIAHSWLLLFRATGNERYRASARAALSYVRRAIRLTGDADIGGGLKGAFPGWGEYGKFQYLSWAAKFFIDAQLLELDVNAESAPWERATKRAGRTDADENGGRAIDDETHAVQRLAEGDEEEMTPESMAAVGESVAGRQATNPEKGDTRSGVDQPR